SRHSTQSMLLLSCTIWGISIVLPAQLASAAWTARVMTSKRAAFLAAECKRRGRGRNALRAHREVVDAASTVSAGSIPPLRTLSKASHRVVGFRLATAGRLPKHAWLSSGQLNRREGDSYADHTSTPRPGWPFIDGGRGSNRCAEIASRGGAAGNDHCAYCEIHRPGGLRSSQIRGSRAAACRGFHRCPLRGARG